MDDSKFNSSQDYNLVTKTLIEELLQDEYCLAHINPLVAGVVLPDHLKKEPTVTVKLSHYFAGVVSLGSSTVEAELRFGSSPVVCTFPYKAIWAVTSIDGKHTIWESRASNPILASLLKSESSDSSQPVIIEVKESKESSKDKKDRPSFLKRVK